MSFIALARLRSFCKTIKADRFRREMKDLIHQIEANVEFIKSKRAGISFSPNDPAVESFLQTEKEEHSSPLSKYVSTLHQRVQDRMDVLDETSIIVGAEYSTFSRRLSETQKQHDTQDDDEEGTISFSKNWLAEKKKPKTVKEKNKKRDREHDDVATEEDLVEDLVLSSDEEEEDEGNDQESDEDGSIPVEDDNDEDFVDPDSEYKKQKNAKSKKWNKRQSLNKAPAKTKRKSHPKKKAKH